MKKCDEIADEISKTAFSQGYAPIITDKKPHYNTQLYL
ncbi:hypothetical protein TSIB_0999 [Thermococcus sibiricus MM 739]|uniref:Uncharacterized protein n=1 Tax=Thermococcus sibiricus (strain DSM 12597 / MM 739) TaxID=604354 RepID=C6A361_THESM|nr:hypothetical protein TSIB_0999 [Thermococcus sibiricus MM 739]